MTKTHSLVLLLAFLGPATACDLLGPDIEDVVGTYELVEALGQPLPVRVDTALEPPDSGEWWIIWVRGGAITLEPDGRFTLQWTIADTTFSGKAGEWTYDTYGTYTLRGSGIVFEPIRHPPAYVFTEGEIDGETLVTEMLDPSTFRRVDAN